MPIISANPSKPKRTVRGKAACQIDLTVTPPYTGAVAGQVNAGELLYLTTSGVSACYNTAHSAALVGVADDTYPLVYTDGVTGSPIPSGDPNVPVVQYYEDGDHLFIQTATETYNPYTVVYQKDGTARQITTVQSGSATSIGYVSPDQRQAAGSANAPVKFPITGAANAPIYIRIVPAKSK